MTSRPTDKDPDFSQAVSQFRTAAGGTVLSARLKSLVALAAAGATTTLHEPAMREHMKAALAAGVPSADIMETLQLISVIGIHSCAIGVPMLLEELEAAGDQLPDGLDEAQQAIKEDFVAKRGYWSPLWDGLLRMAPDFFQAYLEFSAVPWRHGHLTPVEKELVYIAVNASTTHLYLPGLRQHMRNALAHGASPDEIVAVLRLVSTLGLHSLAVGEPLLDELLDEAAGTS